MHRNGRTLAASDIVHTRCFEKRRQGGRLIERSAWLDALTVTAVPRSSSGEMHERMGEALHGTAPWAAVEYMREQFWARLAERIGRLGAFVLFATPRVLGRLREQLDAAIHDLRFHAA